MKSIAALILCGGQGTRLRSVIADKPKVLAPINGHPFLSYLLDQLDVACFHNVILCTGYKGEMVKETLGSPCRGLNIRYFHEPEPLGSGGALRHAFPMIESEIVLVMNGDSYIDVDFPDFLNWFLEEGHDNAILLTKVGDMSRYGSVKINEGGKILRFDEKQEESGPRWINAGTYLLKASLLQHISSEKLYSLERELFPDLIGKSLYGYFCESKFLDIGTSESYPKVERFLQIPPNDLLMFRVRD